MTSENKIAIIDYGVSNLRSITEAVNHFTDLFFLTEDFAELQSANAAILPGVGAFEEGMRGLKSRGLIGAIKDFAASGKPMLGICLGAQLMLSGGHEFGVFEGLDIIPGRVVRFPDLGPSVKIPHIGWNGIKSKNNPWDKSIFQDIRPASSMYFIHSYVLEPKNQSYAFAVTNYEGYEFCSVIRRDNVYGCQFHPEKSGEIGLKIIENFVNLISKISINNYK